MSDSPRPESRATSEPAGAPSINRSRVRDRQSADASKRSRLPMLAAIAAIALAAGGYVFFSFGRAPGGPVAELPVFAEAVDSRDVGRLLLIWDASAPRDEVTKSLEKLFTDLGVPGTTARVEPPRIRRIDDQSCRGMHRMGELDLESVWAWNGTAYRLTSLGIAH